MNGDPSFGEALNRLARETGQWPSSVMVHGIEVIGAGDDPQVLLTGSEATWMPKANRWKYHGPDSKAVVRLSQYRAAMAGAA